MPKKTIYIAGKVTGLPMNEVRRKFGLLEEHLNGQGHEVINPVELVHELDIQNESWEYIMRICLINLMAADELHLMPCWLESRGAMVERIVAESIKMPIVYLQSETYARVQL